MKPKKKITAYSFKCTECGLENPIECVYTNNDKYFSCVQCGAHTKMTEHEIEVNNLPEVGRMVKIVDKYDIAFCGFITRPPTEIMCIDTLCVRKNSADTKIHVEKIKSWCYLKEDRDDVLKM